MNGFRFLFLLFAVTAGHASAAVELGGLQGLGDTRYHFVESEAVGSGYHIFVALPDGYDDADSGDYPTVYLLDGGELYPLLSSYYRYLNLGGEVPDMIIVGISYGTDDWQKGNNRSHDYTAPSSERDHWGGAGRFQSFLGDELIPLVESTYRSRSDRRIIFGQSIGGQFVLYTAQTKPGLFWGHIASNPALHRNLPFFLDPHWNASDTIKVSRLFVGSGSNDDPVFREPALEWISHWTAVDSRPWTLKTVTLDGHSHFSAPPASFRQGISWLFSED